MSRPTTVAAALTIAILMLSAPRECAAQDTAAAQVSAQVAPAQAQVPVQRTGLCAWHVEFCKYRGWYRQVGAPLFTLGAIVLPCWLAFRLYRRRTSGRRMSPAREILLLAAVLYLMCLTVATLTPNRNPRLRTHASMGVELRPDLATLTCASANRSSVPNARAFCRQNLIGNLLLFFPLGVLLPLIRGRLRFRHGVQVAVVLSVGIELLQYLSRALGTYRSVDVNDVLLNVAGACLGLTFVSLLRLRRAVR